MSVNHKEWRVVKVLQYQHCYLLKAKIALLPLQFNVFKMFSASKLLWNKLHSEITPRFLPSATLWEGNVFSCVCLPTGKGFHVTITNDALDLTTTQPLPSYCCWHLMICEARTVSKRALRILLKCFLMETIFMRAFCIPNLKLNNHQRQ